MTCRLCPIKDKALGLCSMHLRRYYKWGDPFYVHTARTTTCSWCGKRILAKDRNSCNFSHGALARWARQKAAA